MNDRLVVIVDSLNDVFQIMLMHNEYLIPLIAMGRGDYVEFMETCRKAYVKYENMTLQTSPAFSEFINKLDTVDKV